MKALLILFKFMYFYDLDLCLLTTTSDISNIFFTSDVIFWEYSKRVSLVSEKLVRYV